MTVIYNMRFLFLNLLVSQTIETNFGLKVRYDGSETANIEVSYDYWNATCGLCGTFDDDKTNEFRLQDGSLVSRALYNRIYLEGHTSQLWWWRSSR